LAGKIGAAAYSKHDAAQNKEQDRGTKTPGSGHSPKKDPWVSQEMGHDPEKADKHMFRIKIILEVLLAIL
jgi:hypothetical protein